MEALSPVETLSEAKRTLARKCILDALAQGASRGVAAASAGIARQTFYNWLREDPAFRTAVEQTEAEVFRAVEAVAFQCALKAAEDPRYQGSLRFFLTHRAKWTTEPEAVEREPYQQAKRDEILAWIDRVIAEHRAEAEAAGETDGADEADDEDDAANSFEDAPDDLENSADDAYSELSAPAAPVPSTDHPPAIRGKVSPAPAPGRVTHPRPAPYTGPPDHGVSGDVF